MSTLKVHWARAEKKAEENLKQGGEEKSIKQAQTRNCGVPMSKLDMLYLQMANCFKQHHKDKQCAKEDAEAVQVQVEKNAQKLMMSTMTTMAKKNVWTV